MNLNASRAAARRVVGRAASLGGSFRDFGEIAGLAHRVSVLEQDLQEQRALSLRVAQLTDIVQELLIPIADRDEERLHRLLQEYSATL